MATVFLVHEVDVDGRVEYNACVAMSEQGARAYPAGYWVDGATVRELSEEETNEEYSESRGFEQAVGMGRFVCVLRAVPSDAELDEYGIPTEWQDFLVVSVEAAD